MENNQIELMHKMFVNGDSYWKIARRLETTEEVIKSRISRLREKDPVKWPRRMKYKVDPKKKIERLFHVYECGGCNLTFAVEQAYEHQSEVCCPVCKDDKHMNDAGDGLMVTKLAKAT